MKTVAIMQPTFLPWIGYFAMAESVDEFILLDDVQFDKRSWQQRNRIKTEQGFSWLTVPVLSRGKMTQRINQTCIDTSAKFPRKQLATIRHQYAKAACFSEVDELLSESPLGQDDHEFLSVLNIELIRLVADYLGLNATFTIASELDVDGAKDVRLFNLCNAVDATRYVSPPGSAEYLDASETFRESSIEVEYFNYEHPVYPQLHGEFVPYLSVIDLMMNVGTESAAVLRGGCRAEG